MKYFQNLSCFDPVCASLPVGSEFEFKVKRLCPSPDIILYASIAKVEQDADEWMHDPASPTLFPDEEGFSFKLPSLKELPEGIYLIKVGFGKAGQPVPSCDFRIRPSDFGISIFQIRTDSDPTKTFDQLLAEYEEAHISRECAFRKGFGEEAGAIVGQEYLAFAFVKNCLLTSRVRIGQYEIIPFHGLSCKDELDVIGSFLTTNHLGKLADVQNILAEAQSGQPTVVVHFPKVIAQSADAAEKLVEQEVQRLGDLLSIHRNSYAEIFACLVVDLKENKPHFRILTPNYRGNFLGGEIAGEHPAQINAQINKVRTDPKLQLYLGLYKEALKEERIEFVYFRLWNVIETIARSKGYVGRQLRDWQGNILKNRQNVDRVIKDEAEELVFELIRETFLSSYGNERFMANHLHQGAISQMVPIWYRHRNCVVHRGGCFPADPAFCFRDKDKFVNCKMANDEIIGSYGSRDLFTDKYLQALNQTLAAVISSQIS